MIPLISFIIMVISLYIWVIVISAVLSWLVVFNIINTQNQFVAMIADTLYRVTEPAMRPIRQVMPDLGGIDISPIVLILGLIFVRDVVFAGWIAPLFY